jgi:hypothetical protein
MSRMPSFLAFLRAGRVTRRTTWRDLEVVRATDERWGA